MRVSRWTNGGWMLKDAIRLMRELRGVVAYAEPVRRGRRLSGREVMAEVPPRRPADRHQHDRHRLAPTLTRAVLQSVDIPLSPHFWTMAGSVRVAQTCRAGGA
jgi:glucarate dehydratase